MKNIIRVLDNDSKLGRVCTFLGTLIMANLMFVLTLIPVITAGAGLCGLYYTMLKLVRYKEVNPFEEFFRGFRDNFKQATLAELALLALAAFLAADIYICSFMTGPLRYCRLVLYAMGIALGILPIYVFPVMATFEGRLRDSLKFSLYFAINNLPGTLALILLYIVPMALTYLDMAMLPLAAFLWCMCGFAVVAFCSSAILMRKFKEHLEPLEEEQEIADRKRILEEMRKLEG